MGIEWQDITSYSRGSDRKTPRWWEAKIAGLRISVGNEHIHYPSGQTWLMNCDPWFRTEELKAHDEGPAKREAIAKVRAKLNEIMGALPND